MDAKTVKESRTIKAKLVLPSDTNNRGTIFGGNVMAYIDEVAAITAMRHSRCSVVTASIDSVDFITPANEGDSVCLEASIASVGRTSMEIFVKVISENLYTGERKLTTTAFTTFVALDENGNPHPVPALIPETEEEKRLIENAAERKRMREERRKHNSNFVKDLKIDKNI
ncbi:acyl-CoA thioesterase [Aneurinibacillus sp. Ricciae_BoGa-3]|uniref:acyl-CoA thioesterase n=1 Tax=Aneurinibacillus sp. Ricciae_BoGa-3 TaxID=3022697 RepID=UPI0023417FBE|nr:acyl-CoA thioesterase [Aneurinibacillus sp. Ricciae_BoGa-3]WCK53377.1 acyl-CoA thioesterase [Aneurinibacillus sp. Ricciae_BoGa-3]